MKWLVLLALLPLVGHLVDCKQECRVLTLYNKKSDDEIPVNELSALEDNRVVFKWSLVNTNNDVKMSLSWDQPIGSKPRWAAVSFCPKDKYDPCKPHTNCDIVAVWFDEKGDSKILDLWGTGPKTVIQDKDSDTDEEEGEEDYTLLTMVKNEGAVATIEFKRKLQFNREWDVSLMNDVFVGVAGGELGNKVNPLGAKPHDYKAISQKWINFSQSSGMSLNRYMTWMELLQLFISIVLFCLFVDAYYEDAYY